MLESPQGVAVTVPVLAHADPTGCAATSALLIPGTWETDETRCPHHPVGILAPVAEAITATHGDRAEVYLLPYMARVFDNGHTYADSTLDVLTEAMAVLTEVSRPISAACVAASPVTALPLLGVCQDLSE